MGDHNNTVEGIQYCGWIASVLWVIPSVLCSLFITAGDNISTLGDTFSTCGDNISTVGDNISTVEGIQYSGERFLIFACLAVNPIQAGVFCHYIGWGGGGTLSSSVFPLFVVQLPPNLPC